MRHGTWSWVVGLTFAASLLGAGGVVAAPTTLPIDQVGDVGQQNAIAIGGDGFPVVSYLRTDNGSLKVTKCGSSDCSTGNQTSTIIPSGMASNGGIAVPADGRPVLTYVLSGAVRLLKCGNSACSSGNGSVSLGAGDSPALAIRPDGLPIIVSNEDGGIRVTRCLDASCSTSQQTSIAQAQTGSLDVAVGADGYPVIASVIDGVGLRAAKCANADCTGVVPFQMLDDFGRFHSKPALAIAADGYPVVAYVAAGGTFDSYRYVRVAKCRDAQCLSGASINVVGQAYESDVAVALASDGLPLIAFQSSTPGVPLGITVAKCGSATCATNSTLTVIDTKPETGTYCGIAVDPSGRPITSYYDAGNHDVFVARCDNATCQGAAPTRALGQSGEPLAFVTAFENAQVAVIDTVSRALVSLIDVGNGPEGVAFSRDGQKAYVTNVSSGNVSYIDVATREVERTVATGAPGTVPRGIAVSPNHSRLYVANAGTNAVAVIDRVAGTVISAVPVGNGPFGLAITPNGATVVTANTTGNSVSFVSTATNTLLGTVPVGTQPYGVATSPDGLLAYVANFGSNSVSVIDVATRTVIDSIAVGLGPFGIAVKSDGSRLYVSDNQNRVSVVDAVTRQSIGSIPVGSHPQGVALTPDDKYLFVANQFSDNVDVIDTATNLIVFTRAVPSDPVSLGAFISPPLVRARQAVEFYHAFFGHYFVSIQEDEIAALDTGVFVGWARTGQTFNVFDLGSGHADVCRFFTTAFAPKSSHFYTPLAFECDLVKQNPDWIYEKIAFQLRLPEAGACPGGTIPLYRLYNNGLTGAPNHRYTTSTAIRTQMIAQGYVPEDDNTACVPPQGGE